MRDRLSTNPALTSGVTFFAVLVAAVVVGAHTSCGLPSIPSLEVPLNPRVTGIDSPGQQILTFDHNPKNSTDDFKGYDLYYKMYPPPSSAASSSLTSDESFIENSPKDTGPKRLQARGFLRLVPVTNRDGTGNAIESLITIDTPPSLPLGPTDTSITFAIDVREPVSRPFESVDENAEEAEIVVTWNDSVPTARGFRRRSTTNTGVAHPDDEYDSFWHGSAYAPSDNDIGRMFSSNSFDLTEFNDSITIVLYAITYGVNGTDFRSYYSEPLRLREATIVVSND